MTVQILTHAGTLTLGSAPRPEIVCALCTKPANVLVPHAGAVCSPCLELLVETAVQAAADRLLAKLRGQLDEPGAAT